MSDPTTLVIGANGGIGTRLVARLQAERPGSVRGMVRAGRVNDTLRDTGAELVEADLEGELRHALEGVDRVVFSAGSGGSTGLDKTLMVDVWGAVRVIELMGELGLRRLVMVSSIGVDDPLAGPESLRPYLVAKRVVDELLQQSGLDWTIVRPGRLTDDDGTGRVLLARRKDWPAIPRDDVAASIHAILHGTGWSGRITELFGAGQGEGTAVEHLTTAP